MALHQVDSQSKSLEAQEEEDYETAKQRSLLDVPRNPQEMVRRAIRILADRGITASQASVITDSFGNCLPDSLIAALYPNICQEDLEARSYDLRVSGIANANELIATMSEAQLERLMTVVTGGVGVGRPDNRQDLLTLISSFGETRVYEGEGGDLFPFLLAYQLRRPLLLVDLHHNRSETLTVVDPEVFFDASEVAQLPIVLTRQADHFLPIIVGPDQEANLLRLVNEVRAGNYATENVAAAKLDLEKAAAEKAAAEKSVPDAKKDATEKAKAETTEEATSTTSTTRTTEATAATTTTSGTATTKATAATSTETTLKTAPATTASATRGESFETLALLLQGTILGDSSSDDDTTSSPNEPRYRSKIEIELNPTFQLFIFIVSYCLSRASIEDRRVQFSPPPSSGSSQQRLNAS